MLQPATKKATTRGPFCWNQQETFASGDVFATTVIADATTGDSFCWIQYMQMMETSSTGCYNRHSPAPETTRALCCCEQPRRMRLRRGITLRLARGGCRRCVWMCCEGAFSPRLRAALRAGLPAIRVGGGCSSGGSERRHERRLVSCDERWRGTVRCGVCVD